MERLSEADKAFYRGIAVVLGYLARDHGEDSLVEYAMKDNGFTLDDFRRARVEGFDLIPIKRAVRNP